MPVPRRRLLATTVLAAALLGTAGAGSAAAPVYYRLPLNDHAVVKPKRIEFSDASLTKLHWRHWGARRATATGRARINTCTPTCAAGNVITGKASARVFKRHTEDSRRIYGCMTARVHGAPKLEWP